MAKEFDKIKIKPLTIFSYPAAPALVYYVITGKLGIYKRASSSSENGKYSRKENEYPRHNIYFFFSFLLLGEVKILQLTVKNEKIKTVSQLFKRILCLHTGCKDTSNLT